MSIQPNPISENALESPQLDLSDNERSTDLGEFFQNAPVLACLATPDGYLTQLGGPWTETLGWTRHEITSRPFLDLVHPDDQASTIKELALLNEGHRTVGFVNRYRRADGRWCDLRWHSHRTNSGDIYAIAWDVTDEVANARALDERTAVLETLNRFQEVTIESNLNDVPVEWLINSVAKITGSSEVMLGSVLETASEGIGIEFLAATSRFMAIADLDSEISQNPDVAGSPSARYLSDLNSLVGAVVRTESVVISDDAAADPRQSTNIDHQLDVSNFLGLPIWGPSGLNGILALADRSPSFDQGVVDLLDPICKTLGSTLAQLSYRRKGDEMELMMNRLSTLFSAVIQDLETMLVVTGIDGSIRFLNPAAERLLGVTNSTLSKQVQLNRFLSSATDDGIQDTDYDPMQWSSWANEPQREWNLRAADGKFIPILISISPLRDDNGAPEGWVHLGTELTERRAFESERTRIAVLRSEVDALRCRERELGLLSQATEYVMASNTTRDALDVIGAFAPSIAGTAEISILHVAIEGSRSEPSSRQPIGISQQRETQLLGPTDCWAVRTGETHLTRLDQATRCRHLPADGSYLCVPISDGERLISVLTTHVSDTDTPQLRNAVSQVEDIARQMGIALSNLNLKRSLQQQAVADPLTGVGNRRAGETALLAAWSACHQNNEPFALVMIDIDRFRDFNNRLGHPVGDRVLQQVAGILRSAVRQGDTVARMGGEEFLIVLRNLDAASAAQVAESLRVKVEFSTVDDLDYLAAVTEQHGAWASVVSKSRQGEGSGSESDSSFDCVIGPKLHDGDSNVCATHGADSFRCTISGGLLHVTEAQTAPDALVAAADAALYLAKAAGRNRLVQATENSLVTPVDANGDTQI